MIACRGAVGKMTPAHVCRHIERAECEAWNLWFNAVLAAERRGISW